MPHLATSSTDPRKSRDKVYIDAVARDASPEHKKALLLNALGVEGLNTYLRAAEDEQQPGADRPTQEETPNVYDAALALLSQLFDPQPDAACLRARFKALCQGPDESAVQFIHEVRRLAKLCEFGAASDILAYDQIVSGIASPQLKRTFYKLGKDFTVQKALDIAKEEERVDRALLQLSGVQVDTVSSRTVQDGGATRRIRQNGGPNGGRPPQASPQDGAGGTSSACTSSPTTAADTSSPAAPPGRAGACYRCESTRHWANSAACPARSRMCSRCGRRGHFARVCRTTSESPTGHQGTSTVTNTVTVLQVDEPVTASGLLHLPVRINGSILNMLIDTGAAVSLLNVQDYKRCFPNIKLLPSNVILKNYSEQAIVNYGYFKASVSYSGNDACITFYVTDKGNSLLGLDAIRALKIIIEGETLSCSVVEPSALPVNAALEPHRPFTSDSSPAEHTLLQHGRRQGVPAVASGFHRRPCQLPRQGTDAPTQQEVHAVITRASSSNGSAPIVQVNMCRDEFFRTARERELPLSNAPQNSFFIPTQVFYSQRYMHADLANAHYCHTCSDGSCKGNAYFPANDSVLEPQGSFAAPFQCPAVVPSQNASFSSNIPSVEPPSSLTAPVQSPAVVPSHHTSTECVVEPPGSLQTPFQCSAVVSSPHDVSPCPEHVSESQDSLQAPYECSTAVPSPHADSSNNNGHDSEPSGSHASRCHFPSSANAEGRLSESSDSSYSSTLSAVPEQRVTEPVGSSEDAELTAPQGSTSERNAPRRSKRLRKKPSRFKDFVS
ncbi:uncharacterized protein LOC125758447 [Rhipicephalus sanguineus]|uniref:uncharacterized protein LOC125758447 n=1 Tax=Rhipicephalus sanguineus TaxID=34632 RepID=UPI0020C51E01|nr:uncharacterized protein LOC125758447 [Rhipicephalus sanguineus]